MNHRTNKNLLLEEQPKNVTIPNDHFLGGKQLKLDKCYQCKLTFNLVNPLFFAHDSMLHLIIGGKKVTVITTKLK